MSVTAASNAGSTTTWTDPGVASWSQSSTLSSRPWAEIRTRSESSAKTPSVRLFTGAVSGSSVTVWTGIGAAAGSAGSSGISVDVWTGTRALSGPANTTTSTRYTPGSPTMPRSSYGIVSLNG